MIFIIIYKMKKNEFNEKLIRLISMFKSWGINTNDWLVCDRFINKKYLEDLTKSSEIHIVIKDYKLPWEIKEKKQIIPPKNTSYLHDFIRYIKADLQVEIGAANKKEFFELLKYSEKIKLDDKINFLQLSPLFHALHLKENIKRAKSNKNFDYYGTLLELEKRLFLYAKEYDDLLISSELTKIYQDRNKNIINTLGGTPVNDFKIKGKVKLIFAHNFNCKINKDNIIVVRNTNVKWIPLMIKAKGVISEEGGLTCHTAIACRELKIPGLVGVKDVLFKLLDGDIIEMDSKEKYARLIKQVKKDYKI